MNHGVKGTVDGISVEKMRDTGYFVGLVIAGCVFMSASCFVGYSACKKFSADIRTANAVERIADSLEIIKAAELTKIR